MRFTTALLPLTCRGFGWVAEQLSGGSLLGKPTSGTAATARMAGAAGTVGAASTPGAVSRGDTAEAAGPVLSPAALLKGQ